MPTILPEKVKLSILIIILMMDQQLELYAMIAHMGNHVYCGHYTSYIKNMKNSDWYHIDDNDIKKVEIDSIDKSDIYMLFYKKI